jgi:predicted nucleic acid-binding protein
LIVLDASAFAELALRWPKAAVVEAAMFAPGETLHAPHLLDVEFMNVIRRYAASGLISPQRAVEGMEDLADLRIIRYPHIDLTREIWALRHNFSAYDATYVSLAEVLGAKFLTLDARLASAVRAHTTIELV